jgi:hypothetical protein
MPISFSPGDSIYDVTPLENFFIQNYMTEATGEFVKVYIYGLMFCYRQEEPPQDYADIARDLHMNEETVRAALAYWEKLQLINIVSHKPLTLEYVNLIHKFISGTRAPDREKDKVFRELASHVQEIFAGERVVAPSEYNRVFDWYDVLKFEPGAISLLIRHCVGRKGTRVSFNYMDAVAQDLAGKSTTSAEGVEAWIMAQEAVNSGAARVLARWSLRRAPTVDEMLMYRKWTEEWGFTEDAVIAACRELTATGTPNFKYLDAIMESFHTEGLTSAQEILSGLEERKRRKDICSDITKALGMRASVSNSTELLVLYDHFSSLGFTDTAVTMAARMLCIEGRHTLADLAALLNKWYEDGTVTDDELKYSREKIAEIDRAVKVWLDIWGQSRAPTPGERAAYIRFTAEWGMTQELVDFAAERSSLADKPLAMMGRMLSGWRERGIADKRAASEDWDRNKPAAGGREDFADKGFANRNTYSKEQFENMYTDIFTNRDK